MTVTPLKLTDAPLAGREEDEGAAEGEVDAAVGVDPGVTLVSFAAGFFLSSLVTKTMKLTTTTARMTVPATVAIRVLRLRVASRS